MASHAGWIDYDGGTTLTGLPISRPKAAIFWSRGEPADGPDGVFSMDVGLWSEDGTQATVVNSAIPDPGFTRFFANTQLDVSGAALNGLVIDGVLTGGWSIDNAAGPVAQRIGYMVFGGASFSGQVFIDTLLGANDGGSQDLPHGLGATPQLVVNLGGGAGAGPPPGNMINFGACQLTAGSPDSQWGLGFWLEAGGHSVPLGDNIHTQSRQVASDSAAYVRWIVNFVPGSGPPFEDHNGYLDMRAEVTAADTSDVTYGVTAPNNDDAGVFGLACADSNASSFFIAQAVPGNNTKIATPGPPEAAMQHWNQAVTTSAWGETQVDGANTSIGGAGRDPDSQMAVWAKATNQTIPIETYGEMNSTGYFLRGDASDDVEHVSSWDADGIVTDPQASDLGDLGAGWHTPAGWIIAGTSAEKRRGALPVLGVG